MKSLQAAIEDLKSRDPEVAEHLANNYDEKVDREDAERLSDAASFAALRQAGHFKFSYLLDKALEPQKKNSILSKVVVKGSEGERLFFGDTSSEAGRSESEGSVSEKSMETMDNDNDSKSEVVLNN